MTPQMMRQSLIRSVREYNQRSEQSVVREHDGILAIRNPGPLADLNFLHIYDEVSSIQLRDAARLFERDRISFNCYLPIVLTETVERAAQCFDAKATPVFSTMLLDALPADVPTSVGNLSFELVETDDQQAAFSQLCAAAFSLPVDMQQPFTKAASKGHQHWLGHVDGTYVTTGTVMFLDKLYWISDITTANDARGNGFGTAMMRHLTEQSVRARATCGLAAVLTAQSLYQRLGYQVIEDYCVLGH